MKLLDTLLFSLTVVTFIIAVHQTFMHGIAQSYWIFMFSTALILIFRYRKGKPEKPTRPLPNKPVQPGKRKKRK